MPAPVIAEPCGVDGCPALAAGDDGFCPVHRGAKRAQRIGVGVRCPKCKRLLEAGEWVTRESTDHRAEHAHCPPKRPYAGKKVDREKPLLEAGAVVDADVLETEL